MGMKWRDIIGGRCVAADLTLSLLLLPTSGGSTASARYRSVARIFPHIVPYCQ